MNDISEIITQAVVDCKESQVACQESAQICIEFTKEHLERYFEEKFRVEAEPFLTDLEQTKAKLLSLEKKNAELEAVFAAEIIEVKKIISAQSSELNVVQQKSAADAEMITILEGLNEGLLKTLQVINVSMLL